MLAPGKHARKGLIWCAGRQKFVLFATCAVAALDFAMQ